MQPGSGCAGRVVGARTVVGIEVAGDSCKQQMPLTRVRVKAAAWFEGAGGSTGLGSVGVRALQGFGQCHWALSGGGSLLCGRMVYVLTAEVFESSNCCCRANLSQAKGLCI